MGMKRKKRASRRRGWLLGSSATQVICISFVLLIALGTLLLTLPISSRSGRLGVVDAMFTATSATCVTGLVVRDTWTQFTPFGQAVVLLLIQVGGLGLVTLTSFFALAAKRRMGFKDLRLLGESVSASGYSQATDVLKIVVKLAMTFEIIGMVLLMIAFVPQFGAEGIWISAFTAISAFCNAGFDILGRTDSLYPSLTAYAADPLVNIVIMLLIIVGGIGFLTWDDVCTHGLHLRRYRMQSKVILSATALLITIPAVLFYLTDFADLPVGERILASLFQSVTPRTAGYNTVDLTEMTDASQAVTILLMLTGGAPGSTAGGMKVTTLAVLIANAIAAFRRREDLQLFHRRLETSTVRNAAAILLLYLGLTFAGAAVISTAEELPLGACLYETASAAGTVGLTLGLTPQLGVLSQSILILLMYFGRVGGLTLIYAAFSGHDLTYARYPQEKITVG
jgi:trk system potassium uptake protein TrkH